MTAKKLTGNDKAAVLLLALGEELAAQILAQLGPSEAKRIAAALTRVGRVDGGTVDAVLVEFQKLLASPAKTPLDASGESARRIIAAAGRALGGNFGRNLGEDPGAPLRDGSAELRDTLADIDAKPLAAYLQREHPQTAAVVLAHLDAKKCGATLKQLPESSRVDLIERIARLESVDPETISELNESLRQELERVSVLQQQPLGGATQVAQLIASMDKDSSERYLDALALRDPALAETVRAQLFTFADLARLDDTGLRLLLAATPRPTLLLAMKLAPAAVRDAILRNHSERARATLLEDIEALGKVRRDAVDAAQRDIATTARRLAAEGRLSLHDDGETFV